MSWAFALVAQLDPAPGWTCWLNAHDRLPSIAQVREVELAVPAASQTAPWHRLDKFLLEGCE